jgi:hypothetical protein
MKEGTAMKSMLVSMAVVLMFCASPASSAEFPKTGEAEYDTYYVDNVMAKIDSGVGAGQSLTRRESPGMSKEKVRSMTCLFTASITGARSKRQITSMGAAFTPTKMATTYSAPSTTKLLP